MAIPVVLILLSDTLYLNLRPAIKGRKKKSGKVHPIGKDIEKGEQGKLIKE